MSYPYDENPSDPEARYELFYGDPEPEPEDYEDGDYEGPDPDAQLEEYHWRLSAL